MYLLLHSKRKVILATRNLWTNNFNYVLKLCIIRTINKLYELENIVILTIIINVKLIHLYGKKR